MTEHHNLSPHETRLRGLSSNRQQQHSSSVEEDSSMHNGRQDAIVFVIGIFFVILVLVGCLKYSAWLQKRQEQQQEEESNRSAAAADNVNHPSDHDDNHQTRKPTAGNRSRRVDWSQYLIVHPWRESSSNSTSGIKDHPTLNKDKNHSASPLELPQTQQQQQEESHSTQEKADPSSQQQHEQEQSSPAGVSSSSSAPAEEHRISTANDHDQGDPSKDSNNDNENENDRETDACCAICLEAFRDNQPVCQSPNCPHRFHVACMTAWLHQTQQPTSQRRLYSTNNSRAPHDHDHNYLPNSCPVCRSVYCEQPVAQQASSEDNRPRTMEDSKIVALIDG